MSRVLGVDYGHKRVGLAVSDPLGITVRPFDVIPSRTAVEVVANLVKELEVDKIVVGLPTSLGGHEGASAEAARALGKEIQEATGVQVVYHDERFTSRMAESSLLEKGMKRRDRRKKLDKVAAAMILQDYLDNQ